MKTADVPSPNAHENHHSTSTQNQKVIDPVFGLAVEPSTAKGSSSIFGEDKCYFGIPKCKKWNSRSRRSW
jgi:YHS domain-containing protein